MFWKHYVKEVLAGFTWEDFLFRNRLKRAAVKLIIESKNRVDIPYNDCTLIVMRGVQKCTCAGASLRGRNFAPLYCIKLDTATEQRCLGLIQNFERCAWWKSPYIARFW